ncbi:MAG: tetraacyldisaccharide 4'-kinase [Daejeonella sp.]|uniref:tetraacyldisaccharide 4'-kinase n=1 Tax=Daejeonella sp. TaxID=2805397 RepID=UPI002736F478|nr:tetraacyldisaccharide 4'-kinase [Daejeonella sp.]MDP3467869.1 tetraacyldisaccharide 4'-kinase [Daejeonella sp.]
MKLIRLLLFPLSILYGIGVILRNLAYDFGVFKSQKFQLPVISVGNLSVGGSGKSPMTEYLIRLLKDKYKIATLSRGYGRKTSGFLYVDANSISSDSGDEPLQFKRKFRDITVAVCENRTEGILRLEPDHELIILDDAFQHRAVKPGFSILLFEYKTLFKQQWLLPSGDLREPLWAIKRADIIVISKCPEILNTAQKNTILSRFRTEKVFFSFLKYGNLISIHENTSERTLKSINENCKVILLTGIANPEPLLEELATYGPELIHHQYPDHYQFSDKNIAKLVNVFKRLSGNDKLIITTEKDVQRLRIAGIREQLKDLPVYYLPVEAEFMEPERSGFNNLIEEYASKPAGNN